MARERRIRTHVLTAVSSGKNKIGRAKKNRNNSADKCQIQSRASGTPPIHTGAFVAEAWPPPGARPIENPYNAHTSSRSALSRESHAHCRTPGLASDTVVTHLHEQGVFGEELVRPALVAADVALDHPRRPRAGGHQEPLQPARTGGHAAVGRDGREFFKTKKQEGQENKRKKQGRESGATFQCRERKLRGKR